MDPGSSIESREFHREKAQQFLLGLWGKEARVIST